MPSLWMMPVQNPSAMMILRWMTWQCQTQCRNLSSLIQLPLLPSSQLQQIQLLILIIDVMSYEPPNRKTLSQDFSISTVWSDHVILTLI